MIGYIAPFQILDYLERLNVVKETSNEYHCTCPVCGDGGFKINKKNGSYQAFKCGCEVKDIREAISPWAEAFSSGEENQATQTASDNLQKKQVASAPLPNPQISLVRLPETAEDTPQPESKVIPEWLQKQGVPVSAVETRYWYSKTQWVSRFEWTEENGIKEKRSEAVLGVSTQLSGASPMSHRFKKTIRQGHIKSNGLIQWSKGSKDWRAYKLSEAVKHCAGKWILGLEGEGCVETARAIATSGITWQGSNWKEKAITSDLTKLIEGGAAGLVYFPDHDEVGQRKAELVKSACKIVDFPCLILSPTDVWSEMPAKGDLTDFVEAHPNKSTNELVTRLEKATKLAAARDEQETSDRALQEKSASLPTWSQSDIAEWLASKYQGQLAWNVEEQEWYHYSSVTEGIWSKGSTERIGTPFPPKDQAGNEKMKLSIFFTC